jgi:ribosomal protein S18 acetylase RimI-like enzyme
LILLSTAKPFTLRPATIDDAPLFYSVIDRTMREFIITTWGAWNETRVQSESAETSCSPNAQVIQIGDIPVGVFVVARYLTYIQLEQIYVLPEYQRMGIGTTLLNNLIVEASQSKLPIQLRVMTINPAKQLYERLGFVVTESTPDFFLMEKVS